MGNIKRCLALCMAMVLLLMGLATPAAAATNYYVAFYNEGGKTPILERSYAHGDKLQQVPPNPKKDGHTFGGWFVNGTAEYKIGSEVTSDLALYPKFTKVPVAQGPWTVSFTYDGKPTGTAQTVVNGALAKEPAAPGNVPNADAKGWGTVEPGSDSKTYVLKEHDFKTQITSDTTIEYQAFNVVGFMSDGALRYFYYVQAGKTLTEAIAVPTKQETTTDKNGIETLRDYTFSGWKFGSTIYNQNYKPTANTTFTAEFTAPAVPSTKYNITFDRAEGAWKDANVEGDKIVVEEVAEGARFKSFPIVTREGYPLTQEWKDKETDEVWNSTTKVTKAVTLVPLWTSKTKYTVTFSDAQGKRPIVYVTHGETVTKPEDPDPAELDRVYACELGHKHPAHLVYKYWALEGRAEDDLEWKFETDTVTANMQIYAFYERTWTGLKPNSECKIPGTDGNCDQYAFTVSYVNGNKPVAGYNDYTLYLKPNDSLVKLEALIKSTKPTTPHYTFQHWAEKGSTDEFNFNRTITGNITIVPIWKADVTAIFNSDGGDYNSLYTLPSGSKLNDAQRGELTGDNAPKREYYSFSGWYSARQTATGTGSPLDLAIKTFETDKETIWGWYNPTTKIIYHENKTVDDTATHEVTIGEGDSRSILKNAPTTPTTDKDDKRVCVGWALSQNAETATITEADLAKLGATTDVYAVWKGSFYVEYDYGRTIGTEKAVSYKYAPGTKTITPPELIDNKEYVSGWSLEEPVTRSSAAPISVDGGTNDVGNSNAGTSDVPNTPDAPSRVVDPPALPNIVNPDMEGVQENRSMKLYTAIAGEEPGFTDERSAGGPPAAIDPRTEGLPATYATQTPLTPDDFAKIATTGVDVTLHAIWASMTGAKIDITFNSVGGTLTEPGTQKVDLGAALNPNTFPSPTLAGMTFGGWYLDAEYKKTATSAYKPTKNITLYARWTCTVTFDPVKNTGEAISPKLLDVGDTVPRPATPVLTDYTFIGWTGDAAEGTRAAVSDEETWDFWTDTVDKATKLTGIWGATVNYDPNGGVFNDKTPQETVRLVDDSASITKPSIEPTRAGFTFEGWADIAGKPFDFAAGTIEKNTVLYAQWDEYVAPPIQKKMLNITVAGYGSITYAGFPSAVGFNGEVAVGSTISITATPDSNTVFTGAVSSPAGCTVSGNQITYTMPAQDATITVSFAAISSGGGGSIGGSSGDSSSDGSTRWSGTGGNKSSGSGSKSGSPAQPPVAPNTPVVFSDIAGLSSESAILEAVAKGYINGIGDGTFQPNAPMTRGMLAAVLYRYCGKPETTGGTDFPDVRSNQYYVTPIKWANSKGFITGTNRGTFCPEDNLTVEQLALILYRFSGDEPITADTMNEAFTDAHEIDYWAREAMLWATANGYIRGANGRLNATGNATREQVIVIMQRFMSTQQIA